MEITLVAVLWSLLWGVGVYLTVNWLFSKDKAAKVLALIVAVLVFLYLT